MNTIDMIILVIVGFFCIKGFIRGMIVEVFTFAGLLIAYVVALCEMSTVADLINKAFQAPLLISNVLGFIFVFVLVFVFFRLIAGAFSRIVQWSFLAWLNRGGGMILGIFKGILITSLLALFISLLPLSEEMERMQDKSLLFKPVRSVAPAVFDFFTSAFPRTKTFYEEIREGFPRMSNQLIDQIASDQLNSITKELENSVNKQGNQYR